MQIRRVDIENFRGIQRCSWRLREDQTFTALIGPGDSTKTTLLSAIERALHDRPFQTYLDTDFYNAAVEEPIRIRVAVAQLPDELIALDALGADLAGINAEGTWTHDPSDDFEPCVIVELLVDGDLEPTWVAFRPPLEDGEPEDEPRPVRTRHRARMSAYRIDDRVDAHLRWSTTSSLGKLTESQGATKATLTAASRAARQAAAEAVTDELKQTAQAIQQSVQASGTAEFVDLKPGLDISLSSNRGNLALFEGDVPLTNFGLGTRRLTGAATQQLANNGQAALLVDEVEHGLEPHRLVHLLQYLRRDQAFSQVFVTTHSPTALQHLDPEDLAMVRSTAGVTEVRSLDDPASLRKLLKTHPEAFLARRVIVTEGKTEYGLVLELLEDWDKETDTGHVPSAALGVIAVEGGGGSKSAGWAKDLRNAGYDVILFIDSDDPDANAAAADVGELGASIVQWPGSVSTESALCVQLDWEGLSAYLAAAEAEAEDLHAWRQSSANLLQKHVEQSGQMPTDVLDIPSWESAGVSLADCQEALAGVSNAKGWFKQVHRGRRLGKLILDTPSLQEGAVATTVEALRSAVYATKTMSSPDGPSLQDAPAEVSEPSPQLSDDASDQ